MQRGRIEEMGSGHALLDPSCMCNVLALTVVSCTGGVEGSCKLCCCHLRPNRSQCCIDPMLTLSSPLRGPEQLHDGTQLVVDVFHSDTALDELRSRISQRGHAVCRCTDHATSLYVVYAFRLDSFKHFQQHIWSSGGVQMSPSWVRCARAPHPCH